MAIRRRVMPGDRQRRRGPARRGAPASARPRSSDAGSGVRDRGHRRSTAASAGSGLDDVGGSRRNIAGSVADPVAGVSTERVVTAELSRPRSTVRVDCRAIPNIRSVLVRSPAMRTYAPADAPRPCSSGCSRSRRWPAASSTTRSSRPARRSFAPMPDWLDPRIVDGLASRGIEQPVHPPGRRDRGGPRRRGHRRRHADRVGQDAVLHAAGPPGDRRGPVRAGAVPVPDQGARPGPGHGVRRAGRRRPGWTIVTSTYDGDTPAPIRSAVRAAGQVVVTNPDMLHSAILPHHTKWFQLFEQLQLIVIDELHTYRGVFGGHVANVLRRLLRHLRPLRQPPGHRVLLGDDREPGRAGRRC